MSRFTITSILLSLALLILSFSGMRAQSDMTTHNMDILPQASYENPALVPDVRFHVGIPGASSIFAEGANSGFHFQNIIETIGDSSYLLMDELIDEHLNDKNHVSLLYGQELFSLGITADDRMYFNFAVTERVNFRFAYPKTLIELPYKGNGEFIGETVEFTPLSLKFTHFREYALGASWQEPGRWSAGARFKLLFAKANAWTEDAYASLHTEADGYALEAQTRFKGHMTLPMGMTPETLDSTDALDPEQYLMNTANWGAAIDLGFNYRFNDEFSASVSVVDLGSINFDQNTYNYKNEKTTVRFEGLDGYKYATLPDSVDFEDEIQNTVDSLADEFQIEETQKDYRMPLTTRFYIGGRYHFNEDQNVGLLFRGQFFGESFWPSATVTYNYRVGKALSFAASYSIAHDSYFNLGLGAAFNMGPVQLYISSDNWLAAAMPERTKYFNVHAGLNIIIPQPRTAPRPMFDPF